MPVPEACGAVWEEEDEAEDEAAEDEAAEDRDKTNHSLTTPDSPISFCGYSIRRVRSSN